jgi:hypothetical protein
MKTQSANILAALSMFALLLSASPMASAAADPTDTPEIRAAIQSAVTRGDHEAVARYYEDAAIELQAKLKEKKELLEHYQDKSYLYGRQAQDLQSHTQALVRKYDQTAKANMLEAALYRKLAGQLPEYAPMPTQNVTQNMTAASGEQAGQY